MGRAARADSLLPGSEFDLWYFDEAGFTLQPSIPYAWQMVGERVELASARRAPKRARLFQFASRVSFFCLRGSIDSHVVTGCFDLFAERLNPALVVIDNAPGLDEEFEERIEGWQKEGLYLKFLPEYSPELNLIEILWRKIKYEWLPLDAYESFETMVESLFDVIRGIGSKYRITFA
ncbi:MAG: transposase [Blastocatellales bacterium]|nr:transposase [Blastocatellales bacterium]